MNTYEIRPVTFRSRERQLARELEELAAQAPVAMGWADEGACRGRGDNLMYPAARPGTAQHRRDAEPARKVCQGCPVRAQCLEYALAVGEDFGIWGGLDEDERRRLAGGPSGVDGPAASDSAAVDGWAA